MIPKIKHKSTHTSRIYLVLEERSGGDTAEPVTQMCSTLCGQK